MAPAEARLHFCPPRSRPKCAVLCVRVASASLSLQNVLGWLKRGGCTELLARARELGVVSIRRAFGDFSNPTVASRQVELQRHGFDLVHTLHPAKGKSNSADISMTIDVMESCR